MKIVVILALAMLLYPTVAEIENGLGIRPGQQIPRDIPARGKGWHAKYLRAKALGHGVYDVRIQVW